MQASKNDIKTLDRLRKRSDFLRVQAAATKWVSKGVIIQVAPSITPQRCYGITVTKRTSKSAVDRNRIKRRLRAACADVLPATLKDGYDIVLIGRVETMKRDYADLKQDIVWCLGKMGVAR
jgi:ribonuclease P protein component